MRRILELVAILAILAALAGCKIVDMQLTVSTTPDENHVGFSIGEGSAGEAEQ